MTLNVCVCVRARARALVYTVDKKWKERNILGETVAELRGIYRKFIWWCNLKFVKNLNIFILART
jgi:predicted DNA-binding protein (UPF0278 family)